MNSTLLDTPLPATGPIAAQVEQDMLARLERLEAESAGLDERMANTPA